MPYTTTYLGSFLERSKCEWASELARSEKKGRAQKRACTLSVVVAVDSRELGLLRRPQAKQPAAAAVDTFLDFLIA